LEAEARVAGVALGLDELEGDGHLELHVARRPDRAHPAAPDDALQPELSGDHIARRETGRYAARGLHAGFGRGSDVGVSYHDPAVGLLLRDPGRRGAPPASVPIVTSLRTVPGFRLRCAPGAPPLPARRRALPRLRRHRIALRGRVRKAPRLRLR